MKQEKVLLRFTTAESGRKVSDEPTNFKQDTVKHWNRSFNNTSAYSRKSVIRHSKTQTQTSKLSNEGKIKKYEKSICSFFNYQQSSIMSSKEEKKKILHWSTAKCPIQS